MFWALMFLLKDPSDLEKEHLKVYLRIRPFSSAEIESGESQVKIKNKLHGSGTALIEAPWNADPHVDFFIGLGKIF